MSKKKVMLVYLTLIHYRESLFQELSRSESIEFLVCCGKDSLYGGMKNFDPTEKGVAVKYVKNRFLFKKKLGFVWQQGLFKVCKDFKPDHIIFLGPNPQFLSSLLLFTILKFSKVKLSWWGHATFGGQGLLGKKIRLLFFRLADMNLTYDQRGADRLIKEGVEQSKTHVIWNCINSSTYLREPTIKPTNVYNLVYVGRMYNGKKLENILYLADKMRHLVKFKFKVTLIGDGEILEKLIQIRKDLDLFEYVDFKGALYKEDVSRILETCHVGIVPALVGLSVIDFIGKGIPVITERGLKHGPEISAVIDEKTGLLYKQDDIDDLVKCAIEIKGKLKEYEANCIELAWNHWHPKSVAIEILKAIKQSENNN